MKPYKLYFLNKDIISLIITVLISLNLFFSNDSTYVKNIEERIIDFVSYIVYPKTWYEDILIVKTENDLLKQRIIQLKLLNSKLDNYQLENDKLKKMLVFKESYPRLSLKPANKVNHNYSSIFTIILNVGREDGIDKNQAVLDMNGLVGKTIVLGNQASKVQLITDRNFAVSVKVGKEMILSTFKPTHGRLGYLERVIKSIDLNIGDIIYTSGVSQIYPSDLPVAKIKSIKNNPNKIYQDVIVEILADIDNLNYVFIVQ
jgi:rod shape-determining protein MreC